MDLRDANRLQKRFEEADLQLKYSLSRRAEIFRRFLPHDLNEKLILDIGIHHGDFSKLVLKDQTAPHVVGLDFSPLPLKIAKSSGFIVLQGDALKLPFKNSRFDVVFCGQIFEHVPNPLELLDEAHRVLKEDGVLILSTVNTMTPPLILMAAYKNLKFLLGLENITAYKKDLEHINEMHILNVIGLVNVRGFVIEKIDMLDFHLYPDMPDRLFKFLQPLTKLFPFFCSTIVLKCIKKPD